jgi:DNA-directed RNA polymerase subunit RPC12/RpoP
MHYTEPVIRVYYCGKCGSYFGSSSMGNLENQTNETHIGPLENRNRGSRSRCPYCGTNRTERYARLIPVEDVAEVKKEVLKEMRR